MEFAKLYLIALIITVLPFVIYILRKSNHSNDLTVLERNYYQKMVNTKKEYRDLVELGSCQSAAERFKLIISVVPDSELKSYDSLLRPTEITDMNGEIWCKMHYSDNYGANFRCYHEIVHYIEDVGIGKPVTEIYAKDHTGETRSHREQIRNFIAAAVAIPEQSLIEKLNGYKGDVYDVLNDIVFLSKLQDDYKMPLETVKRRITEVCFQ